MTTDYKSLKLIATSSPHIRGEQTTQSIMRDVLIALCPALLFACYNFGVRALSVTAFSAAACVFFEWAYRRLMNKPQSVGDLSAVVTGVLLAFVCPVQIPYWTICIGDFFAIILVKQLFGGIGCNFVNPALAGRAALLASYAGIMTTWANPVGKFAAVLGSTADVTTTATPLAQLKGGTAAFLMSKYSVGDMFLGTIPGSVGEVSALALLIGFAWLLYRKIINWQTPVFYIGTVAVLAFLFPRGGLGNFDWMIYNVLGGGLILGAVFMATDYATSPVTAKGQAIFGVGCGLFTIAIRYFGSYNEGVCYSIMVMNLFVPLIDRYVKPPRFGVVEESKKEAAT
ncbi:MAG: RnfABCDGE type electron transport complex subunit D [Oscillospiraceae bacterium]|nr:RnfABCDGE type electron transport complex subunit D [Oscillospiraceae bacterium]